MLSGEGLSVGLGLLVLVQTVTCAAGVVMYCEREYYDCQFSEFVWKFEDIYWCTLDKDTLPNGHQRVGSIATKLLKLIAIPLLILLLGRGSLLLLILTHCAYLIYVRYFGLITDSGIMRIRTIETVMYVVLEASIFLCLSLQSLADSSEYFGVGQ